MKKMLLSCAAVGLLLTGCASTPSDMGMPAPQMTFQQFSPLMLNVQSASVVDAYIQSSDPQDVSGQFVLPPAEAVKRYAAQRYRANGAGTGQFVIAIEDARIHVREIDQKNKALEWSKIGREDEYRLFLQLRVTAIPDGVQGNEATIMKFERTLVIPSSTSVADRELKQVAFLEKMMADVDARIQAIFDDVPSLRQ